MMNVFEYMKLHNITDEDIEAKALQFENETFEESHLPVHSGSHLDAVGKKRVTVVYNAGDVQQVNAIARQEGIKPSEVYRKALAYYLTLQNKELVSG